VTGEIGSMQNSSGSIWVQWVRSGIGFTRRQKEIVRSLGLRRLRQVVSLPDTASVRGLVVSVAHLVQIVQPAAKPAWLSIPEYSIRTPERSPKEQAAESAANEPVQEGVVSSATPESSSSESFVEPQAHASGESSPMGRSQE
jgi:large subunit ribosomal protein L30